MLKKIMSAAAAAVMLTGCGNADIPADKHSYDTDMISCRSVEDFVFPAFMSGAELIGTEKWKPLDFICEPPELSAGEFAVVTADVFILNGGEEGFRDDVEVREIKNVEKATFADISVKYAIHDISAQQMDRYTYGLFTIENGEKWVHLDSNRSTVYGEGGLVAEFAEHDRIGAYAVLYNEPPSAEQLAAAAESENYSCGDFYIIGE